MRRTTIGGGPLLLFTVLAASCGGEDASEATSERRQAVVGWVEGRPPIIPTPSRDPCPSCFVQVFSDTLIRVTFSYPATVPVPESPAYVLLQLKDGRPVSSTFVYEAEHIVDKIFQFDLEVDVVPGAEMMLGILRLDEELQGHVLVTWVALAQAW